MRTEDQVAAMSCPVCRVPLAMSDRQGIEIDYCPQCRGVWLDRGELDKIIERSAPQAAAPPPSAPPPQSAPAYQATQPGQQGPWGTPGYDQRTGYSQDHAKGYGQKGYKKRKSWLEDIFD